MAGHTHRRRFTRKRGIARFCRAEIFCVAFPAATVHVKITPGIIFPANNAIVLALTPTVNAGLSEILCENGRTQLAERAGLLTVGLVALNHRERLCFLDSAK